MSGTAFSPREKSYTITEVQQISGLAAHTLRWYEQLGLIDDVSRGPGGKRIYSAQNLRWVEFLNRVRDTGMSVADMTRYAQLAREGDHTMPERRRMVEEHRARVRQRAAEIAATLEYLDWKVGVYLEREKAAGMAPPDEAPVVAVPLPAVGHRRLSGVDRTAGGDPELVVEGS